MRSVNFKEQWREWLMLLFGVWLVVSPFVLGYAGAGAQMAVWNPVIVGVVVVVFAIAEIMKPQTWEEWISLLLGAWLIAAPFVLGYTGMTAALWNSVIMGLLIGADAVWTLIDMKSHGGRTTA
ncbi:SPW repeat protein [Litchfieldella rifensis]|uniref:SPW repeat protein n=1 Tax=Litchfieldella rifensis TaxID=762643 RepID=A0ABV7LPU4_9GAMM